MYHYIVDKGDSIVLESTKDILAIPDGCEIIEESDIEEYFPFFRGRNDATKVTHEIVFGQYAGKYIVAGADAHIGARTKLFKYDQFVSHFATKFNEQLERIISNRNTYSSRNTNIQQIDFDDYMIRDLDTGKFMPHDSGYAKKSWYTENHAYPHLLGVLMPHTTNPLEMIVRHLHDVYFRGSDFGITNADDLLLKVHQKIKEASCDTNGVPDKVRVDFSSKDTTGPCGIITVQRDYYDKTFSETTKFKIEVAWTKDRAKVLSEYKKYVPNYVLEKRVNGRDRLLEEAVQRITRPTSIILDDVVVIKPIDKSKASRVKFLRAVHRLKLYSITSNVRAALCKIYKYSLPLTDPDELFDRWLFQHHGWDLRSRLYYDIVLNAGLDAELIGEINDLINKRLNKKAIRRKLFNLIRKDLYYADDPKGKTK